MKFYNAYGFTATILAISLLTGCSTSDMQTLMGTNTAMSTTSAKYAPTNPEKVKIYYSNNGLPKHYKVIGRVSVNNDNPLGMPHSQQTIAQEMRKQAAAIGGNGVVNINAGLEQTTGDIILTK